MSNEVTFWSFLNNNEVEIPIIQRDYAQGRIGEEYLRRNFLEDIKNALDGKLPNKEKKLKLDFIYSSKEDNKLQPLDGQQRLTTMWLLHWYIALQAGKAEFKEACGTLNRFSYETRISSREFFQNLCDSEHFESFEGDNIFDFIQNQTWFLSKWNQDPTIKSMFCMLSGTKSNDNDNDDIVDGIEKLFKETEQEKYIEYWNKLIGEDSPIVFYHLPPLEDFGLSDDLYIKMNARGKPLTHFENFKADLVGYMRKQANNSKEWEEFLNPKNDLSIDNKMDARWTDIFWKHNLDGRIDDIYFAFLNRFFWNELFIAKKPNSEAYLLVNLENLDNKKTKNIYYNHLNDEKPYKDLEPYKFFEQEDGTKGISLDLFKDLQIILDNYSKYTKDKDKNKEIPCAKWLQNDFKFIPEYSGQDITMFSNKVQRVIFFALCKYFSDEEDIKKPADEKALKRWMRVVCNLVSGKDRQGDNIINENSSARTAIEYITSLDSHNVYNSLKDKDVELNKDGKDNPFNFKGKCNEEIIKARQILDDNGQTLRKHKSGKNWEDIITEAEEYSFFNGSIRFLYQEEDKNKKLIVNWDNFDTKWKNAKIYFKEKPEDSCCVNSEGTTLLKVLISQFNANNFATALFNKKSKLLNNNIRSWRYYLLNNDICNPVHQLLMMTDIKMKPRVLSNNFVAHRFDDSLYYLTHTNLLDLAITSESWIHDMWCGNKELIAIQRRTDKKNSYEIKGEYVLLGTNKYDFLLNQDIKNVEDNNEIKGTNLHFENSDIFFDYKNGNFIRWGENRWIYLQKEHGSYDSIEKDPNAKTEHDMYYCFDPCNLKSSDEILKELEDLAKEIQKK